MGITDKLFTFVSDVIIRIAPFSSREKKAYQFYRRGLAAQIDLKNAKALRYYEISLKLEEKPRDRTVTIYNMAVIYQKDKDLESALKFVDQCLNLAPNAVKAHVLKSTILYDLIVRECPYPSNRDENSKDDFDFLDAGTDFLDENIDLERLLFINGLFIQARRNMLIAIDRGVEREDKGFIEFALKFRKNIRRWYKYLQTRTDLPPEFDTDDFDRWDVEQTGDDKYDVWFLLHDFDYD